MARLTRALAAVAILALAFTAVNVTLFAVSRDVPWPIALLLDPMVALALATVLYAEARLSSWGIRPPAWSATLRWFTGLAATLMNCWDSLWPDGYPGWPSHADPAAVFLHAVPPLLLILLTETVAAYRRYLTPHLTAARTQPAHPRTRTEPGSGTGHNRPGQPGTPTYATTPPGPRTSPASVSVGPPLGGHSGASRPEPVLDTERDENGPPPALSVPVTPAGNGSSPRGPEVDPDAALLVRAADLDRAARALTGRPVSIRRLRAELTIGTNRARRIHHRLSGTEQHPPPVQAHRLQPRPGASANDS